MRVGRRQSDGLGILLNVRVQEPNAIPARRIYKELAAGGESLVCTMLKIRGMKSRPAGLGLYLAVPCRSQLGNLRYHRRILDGIR